MNVSGLRLAVVCSTCWLLGWPLPAHARFLQVDPVGYKDQKNLHAYVRNDPLNMADSTGQDAIVIIRPNGDINVRLPVRFYGDAARDPANVGAITNSMQSVSQNIDGINFSLTVVPVTTREIAAGAEMYNDVELSVGPVDVVGGINGGHSQMEPGLGNSAHITMMDTQPGHGIQVGTSYGEGAKYEATGAHYAGHLMGLTDTRPGGNGVMAAGTGTALTRGDLARITQTAPPRSGVRNRIIRCPSSEPECSR